MQRFPRPYGGPGEPGWSKRDSVVAEAEAVAEAEVQVRVDAEGAAPDVVLIATGSEMRIALDARAILHREGIAARVVTVPCPQPPAGARARVSVAAGSALGCYELLGEAGIPVRLDQCGARGAYTALHQQHGFSAARVAATARAGLARAGQREGA
ncbi:transketolase C-terminal domain-containing protein [Streptomyces sp. KS 21]|uniref:transketolase-like TK C-terminal-containing protein n=1 Tax=Streptomyces sp. KS 21 TaxID=2485150 RepID=UPI0010635774|nr:transketolase C-terminal domain-containing protein [Streptomyces sp. KS 21]TDU77088.1 transketolase-like protein [Streptomyces sp. KS 21]